MELSGDIIRNLRSAVQSATRLRGRPVHPDTLGFWQQLLKEARRQSRLCEASQLPMMQGLIVKLENAIAEGPR